METVKYDNFEIEKSLHTFLKKKRALSKFVRNTKEFNTGEIGIIQDIWDAFLWEGSPEGYNFWCELDNKFENQ